MQHLPCLEVETSPNPDASIIWLHGLGADGSDFLPIVPQLQLPTTLAVRFIFPHAPSMPVTINAGVMMPAWYDIDNTSLAGRQDSAGILHSAQQIQQLIQREVTRGIAASRIILAGFSQGGALALYVGIRQTQPLAGILALSCYTLLADTMNVVTCTAASTPIMIAHGRHDDVVDISLGEQSVQYLLKRGLTPQWHTYPMAHAVCDDEIDDISIWIQRCLL